MSRRWSGILAIALGFSAGLILRHGPDNPPANAGTSSGNRSASSQSATATQNPKLTTSDPHQRSAGHLSDLLVWLPEAGAQDILDLLDEWDRSDFPPHPTARLWCILRLSEIDPAKAFELAEDHGTRFPRHTPFTPAYALLRSFLASSDPDRYADPSWLESLGVHPQHCKQLARMAKRRSADAPPLTAFQEAKANGLPLRQKASALAVEDPAALAGELKALGPAHPGFLQMAHALLRAWPKKDQSAAREWLNGIEDPDLAAELRHTYTLATALATENRVDAARLVNELPPGSRRADALTTMFHTWGREDFESARQWAETNLTSLDRVLVLSKLSERFVESDPLRALQVLQPYQDEIATMPHGWPFVIRDVELADGGPSWNPFPMSLNSSPRDVVGNARERFALVEPRSFLELEMTQAGDESAGTMTGDAKSAIQRLVAQDAPGTIDWIERQSDHHWQPDMLKQAGEAWAKDDLPGVRRWLDTHPDPSSQTGFSMGVAARLRRERNFQDAWEIAAPFGMQAEASATLGRIGAEWIQSQPEEARSAIENTRLTEHLRKRFDATLDRATP